MEYSFSVNGFPVAARYSDDAVDGVCAPLLRTLTGLRGQTDGRVVAFLAAPPGTGKSTLAAFLEHLSRQRADCAPIQALGMDGFHYHADYIARHSVVRGGARVPMQRVKGAPESFDAVRLAEALIRARREAMRWPFYDRQRHDVVEDAVPVSGEILLVEGNWLLLDAPVWRDLECDYSVFIAAEESQLRERLIARKMRGGLSREAAERHYEDCDGPNIRLCMSDSRPGDLNLRLAGDGGMVRSGV